MHFLFISMAGLVLLLGGCVGSGSSGNSLSTATANAFSDYVLVNPVTGSTEMRADVPDLATNPTYRSSVIVFRRIHGGGGALGTSDNEAYREADDFSHYRSLTVAEHFLAVFELTNAQYEKLAGSSVAGDALPKTDLSPAAVDTLLDAASSRLRLRLRLPSANEWEYDCRAGALSLFSWGDQTDTLIPSQYATTYIDAATAVAPVGSRSANGFGIFDMHGNVWELTSDESATSRAICGGSWRDPLLQARCANRAQLPIHIGHPLVGIRLVLGR